MINTVKERANLYEYLTKKDVITKLKPLLNKGYKIRHDGRFTSSPKDAAIQWNTPWVHQYQTANNHCYKWHTIFFNNWGMTPTRCKDCWKVVVMPRTLVELFDLYELQKELERPSKCGVELRATDERKYGGYFYNRGYDQGSECFDVVSAAVAEKISPDVRVILKCACTEFELKNGPVQEYEASESQIEVENLLDEYLLMNDIKWSQPDFLTAYVMISWIHRAILIGDLTYKEFTNGESLVKPLKTYKETENG